MESAKEPRLRIAAARALAAAGSEVVALAAAMAADPEPAVRREAALMLRDVAWEDDHDVLLALARPGVAHMQAARVHWDGPRLLVCGHAGLASVCVQSWAWLV